MKKITFNYANKDIKLYFVHTKLNVIVMFVKIKLLMDIVVAFVIEILARLVMKNLLNKGKKFKRNFNVTVVEYKHILGIKFDIAALMNILYV